MPNIGLLHPGAMGASIGAVLQRPGSTVRWCSAQRRDEAARRGRGVVARGDHEAAADIYARLAPFKSEAVSFDAVLRRLGGQAER